MELKTLSLIVVLLVAIGSAFWNIHVKKSSDQVAFVTLMVIPQFIISLPLALLVPIVSLQSFYYILASSLVQTGYILFLSNSYRHGLINRVYPLAIGIPPLLSLIFWHFILKNPISLLADLGIILLSVGIMSFTFAREDRQAISVSGIIYAIATSIFIFLYTLIDTFGVRNAYNPIAYISWLFVIKALILFIPVFSLYKLRLFSLMKQNNSYIIAGLLAGMGYAVAIWAFTYTKTPSVLAIRATSIVFVFIFSIFYLKEPASRRIFLLTLVTALGVFLILADE
ncbi:hypothetical protein ACQUW5_02635 [Legionella sp. CNM-1927-20]|uniref:EamA family transporter n=1 Tax=Legionella sp. CNM-1927-20 TaxID=3422221 RepID=UPI00403AA3D0